MPLLLDSADLQDVRRAAELGFVAGVTTNPTLVARTGRDGKQTIREILELIDGPVFYQVTAGTIEGRAVEAREVFDFAPERMHIKIPAAAENFTLAKRLTDEGIHCAITAVYTCAQAYLAGQVGATYIAPYVHRITTRLGDGISVVRDCAALLKCSRTRIVAASLKSVDEVMAVILAGAHDVTIPLDLILQLAEHELSQQAIRDFSAAVKPS